MLVPLTLAVPAAVASIAYLNARTQFGHDYSLLSSVIANALRIKRSERRDRVNLYYVLEDHAKSKSTANNILLIYEGKEWTYKEVYEVVLKYATWLKTTYAIGPGEVVAMDFMNSPQFIFLWMAIWSVGATPAFINYNLTGAPLLHCLKTSTARIVFVDEEIRPQFCSDVLDPLASPDFRDGKGFMQIVNFDPALEEQILATNGVREPDSSRSDAKSKSVAILVYTSGTTGLPKPAMFSWNKCSFGSIIFSRWMGMTRKDRFYTCMPLYHSAASGLGFCPTMIIGATLVLGHKFSNRTFWPEIRSSKATILHYVGETCRYLLTAPPQIDPKTGEDLDNKNNIRIAFGNGLRPDVWDKFKERFGIDSIAEFYAATEGASASWNFSSNSFSRGAIGRYGSLGQLIMGTLAAIVEVDWETEAPKRFRNNQNLCKEVPRGIPGELMYKLDPANIDGKYLGYLNNEKANQAKIMRDVLKKGDAWFRSGDVVSFDKEGRYWFCDRIGDTFRWKSENVSTSEVSEALGLHPAILDPNVYGVEIPHHDGRAGCVAVMFDRDVDQNLLNDVANHTSKTLPKYAIPIFLRVTKELQATGNNKQQKHVLRAQGVEPSKMSNGDQLFWFKDGSYVKFGERDWEELSEGRVRL